MAKFQVDFPDDREFELIDVGTYECIVDAIEERTSAANQPYLNWSFRIVDDRFRGRILFYMTSLQEQALWNLKRVLKAVGSDVEAGIHEVDTEKLVGKRCTITVRHEEYEGTMRERVANVGPSSGKRLDVPEVDVPTTEKPVVPTTEKPTEKKEEPVVVPKGEPEKKVEVKPVTPSKVEKVEVKPEDIPF